MVSIKNFILFSTLFFLSSAVSTFEQSIRNADSHQKLKVNLPWLRISVVSFDEANDNSTLFILNTATDKTCTIESAKFRGQFINCLGEGFPCHLFDIPTPFSKLEYGADAITFNDPQGLRLTIGKTKENYLSLEKVDARWYQDFVGQL